MGATYSEPFMSTIPLATRTPRTPILLGFVALLVALPWPQAAKADDFSALKTIAERTEYQATSRYDDVMNFCLRLADLSPRVTLRELGKTNEGRTLPLLIVADPMIDSPSAARCSKKLVALVIANIHAGEVCGKEAMLAMARDLAEQKHPELLDNLVLLIAPIYNADGNERMSTRNRPGQNGPAEGMGQRPNAQGLDLNRDNIKLQSPEARALASALTEWDPDLFIDCHTTNGSYHRYALTYDSPRHPATDAELARWTREEFLAEVTESLQQDTGYRSFFYGNFDRPHQRWDSYPAEPRYTTHYAGLRNHIGILSEAYAYASYRDRVLATYGFVKHCLQNAVRHRAKIAEIRQNAARAASQRWDKAEPTPIRFAPEAWKEFSILGFVEEPREGRRPRATEKPRDYPCMYYGLTQATLSIAKPFAYIAPASQTEVIANLHAHGVKAEVLREDVELNIDAYRITAADVSQRTFQDRRIVTLETESQSVSRMIPAGSILVRTDQPLSRLIVNLLEPQAADGLATWGFFAADAEVGDEFPVVRLNDSVPLLTADYVPPHVGPKEPLTYDQVYGRNKAQLGGAAIRGLRWIDDDHFETLRERKAWSVEARTGRLEPLPFDADAVAKALEKLPGVDARAAARLADSAWRQSDAKRRDALLTHDGQLLYVTLDGQQAAKLTSGEQPTELGELSPDGSRAAFVRDWDLWVSDVATQQERRLTTGGSEILRRGKADWVYFEEIYNRNWKAFHWSPDSQTIALQEFNDAEVGHFEVLNHLGFEQSIERDRYPLAGSPNPTVRLGLVSAAGGDIRWIDFAEYPADNTLITRFTWRPDSSSLLVYLQDRAQRWLDVMDVNSATGEVRRLFRDETPAWIDDPGEAKFLNDGSFLLFSTRDGFKHLYHYAVDGGLLRQLTEGEWEVDVLHQIDEEQGWLLISAKKDADLASNLYRVALDDGRIERLTSADGNHSVTPNPSGTLFIDTHSSRRQPDQVRLYTSQGALQRTLDINPTPDVEKYALGDLQFVRIPTRDGFELEASLVLPPKMEPGRKYPVWLMTYAGPHAPTMSDSWRGGRAMEHLLANMGIIAFRVDPRSASNRGARSTWTAYRQLGVQELMDLEDAVQWLHSKPYVNSERIGMNGHSYGGFMTAYAMTHCKLFAAGIAGAPVTDWRNYDTIYTERYMDTPQNNPEGYKKTSVVEAAGDLHGRLLILHGARDDNVHVSNTMQFIHALQNADKSFELMIYPNSRHGIRGAHYNRLIIDFIRKTMLD